MRAALAALGLLVGLSGTGAAGEPMTISPHRVISVVTGDWNEDGEFDRAVLIEGEEDADLRIYLSNGGEEGMALAAMRIGIAWRGAMWGTLPSLALNSAGSLQVFSGNEAVGRHRWQETLTIAYRRGRFVVAGFTFISHDTVEAGLNKHCDVNYLSGRALLDEEPFEVDIRSPTLEEWSPAMVPDQCAAG